MALTENQITSGMKRFVQDNYVGPNKTADLTSDDIYTAIASVDAAMDRVLNTIPGAWGTKAIKQALIDNLPEPFQSASTAAEKASVISVWAMSEAGVI